MPFDPHTNLADTVLDEVPGFAPIPCGADTAARQTTIRALSRGLDVLQAINQHRSLSMMAIANMCDIPDPTACRLVDTLLAENLIEREPTRKQYRPTERVRTLSAGYQQDDELGRAARPHIIALTRAVNWLISVCTRVGMTMMICESTHAIAPSTCNIYHPGYTMPLLGSSSGKAYLAFCAELDRRTTLHQLTGALGRSVPALEAELAQIRAHGYATYARIRSTANPGKTSAISVPVHADGVLASTVTLAFFSSAMLLQKAIDTFAPRLKATASAVGADLAGHLGEGKAMGSAGSR
jgi:IclR family mhp operon transcriptional activator